LDREQHHDVEQRAVREVNARAEREKERDQLAVVAEPAERPGELWIAPIKRPLGYRI
jgi:hypothetical protein